VIDLFECAQCVELYSNFILLMLIFLVGPYELLWFIGDITIYKNSWDWDLLNKSSHNIKCDSGSNAFVWYHI